MTLLLSCTIAGNIATVARSVHQRSLLLGAGGWLADSGRASTGIGGWHFDVDVSSSITVRWGEDKGLGDEGVNDRLDSVPSSITCHITAVSRPKHGGCCLPRSNGSLFRSLSTHLAMLMESRMRLLLVGGATPSSQLITRTVGSSVV